MKHLDVIVDMQFGSTGKGLIAGYLATNNAPDTIITAWAPNAGHTFIDSRGRKFVHTMLGNGIVSPNLRRIMIGPGSVINPDALLRELDECSDLVERRGIDLIIHPHAAVVLQQHVDEEAGPMTKIGSTKKGAGAAAIHRIRRNPDDNNVAIEALPARLAAHVVSASDWISIMMEEVDQAQLEGAQGFSLSMYHGFYPYCTSRDVSSYQTLADGGIPGACRSVRVIGTARTYPIRVANRFDERGKMIGWSGPCYSDQEETSFEALGQAQELTTVTKLPRRIFTWSEQQIREAVAIMGVDEVFLNFIQYDPEYEKKINFINGSTPAAVSWIGTGPTINDVHNCVGIGG